jgi:hypothetical protein
MVRFKGDTQKRHCFYITNGLILPSYNPINKVFEVPISLKLLQFLNNGEPINEVFNCVNNVLKSFCMDEYVVFPPKTLYGLNINQARRYLAIRYL